MSQDPKDSPSAPVGADSEAIEKIQTLPLGTIIYQAVTRCAKAQQETAASMLEYIEEAPFTKVDGKRQAEMLRFDCMVDGKKVSVRLPLTSVVPPQFIQIRDVEIDFTVTIDTKSLEKANVEKRRILPVRLTPSLRLRKLRTMTFTSIQNKSSVHNNIKVKIKASNLDMSGGMARILEMAGTRAILVQTVEDKK